MLPNQIKTGFAKNQQLKNPREPARIISEVPRVGINTKKPGNADSSVMKNKDATIIAKPNRDDKCSNLAVSLFSVTCDLLTIWATIAPISNSQIRAAVL